MTPDPNALPEPVLKRAGGLRFSLIWLVPLVALIAGAVLAVRTYLKTGPTIHLSFDTAEGLEENKTEVRYKDVVIGKVKHIKLSEDDTHVIVDVALVQGAGHLAVEDSRFWIVRPRIGIGGVSGIGTLLSGAYIGVDIGGSEESRSDFTGLEKPPAVTHDQKGRRFLLRSGDAGSITLGSPVYYRRVAVGRIVDAGLDADGKRVSVQIFVDAPYDRFVTANSRFWNAGGVDLALNSQGLKVNTQSLATVLAGGLAFQSLNDEPAPPAEENAQFELFAEQTAALAPPDGPSQEALLVFRQSTRGLSVGAGVDFQGIQLGNVKSILPEYDTERKTIYTKVLLELFPERLGAAYRTLLRLADDHGHAGPEQLLQRFVDQGLQAQLRSGNLITSQLYVALFFKPGAAHLAHPKDGLVEIPTAPGSLEEIQTQIESIVRKINAIPFEDLGNKLRDTLSTANSLLKQIDHDTLPEVKQTLQDAQRAVQSLDKNLSSPEAPLQQDARRTLEQVNRAAASLRTLADYLEQHPDSLLRGKRPEHEPAAPPPKTPPEAPKR